MGTETPKGRTIVNIHFQSSPKERGLDGAQIGPI